MLVWNIDAVFDQLRKCYILFSFERTQMWVYTYIYMYIERAKRSHSRQLDPLRLMISERRVHSAGRPFRLTIDPLYSSYWLFGRLQVSTTWHFPPLLLDDLLCVASGIYINMLPAIVDAAATNNALLHGSMTLFSGNCWGTDILYTDTHTNSHKQCHILVVPYP